MSILSSIAGGVFKDWIDQERIKHHVFLCEEAVNQYLAGELMNGFEYEGALKELNKLVDIIGRKVGASHPQVEELIKLRNGFRDNARYVD